jgi:hypothetical protein
MRIISNGCPERWIDGQSLFPFLNREFLFIKSYKMIGCVLSSLYYSITKFNKNSQGGYRHGPIEFYARTDAISPGRSALPHI